MSNISVGLKKGKILIAIFDKDKRELTITIDKNKVIISDKDNNVIAKKRFKRNIDHITQAEIWRVISKKEIKKTPINIIDKQFSLNKITTKVNTSKKANDYGSLLTHPDFTAQDNEVHNIVHNELQRKVFFRYVNIPALSNYDNEKFYNVTFDKLGLLDKPILDAFDDLIMRHGGRFNESKNDVRKYVRADLHHLSAWPYEKCYFHIGAGSNRMINGKIIFQHRSDVAYEINGHVSLLLPKNVSQKMHKMPNVTISLQDIQNDGLTLSQLYNSAKVTDLFGQEPKFGILHDLKSDQAYFAASTTKKDRESLSQTQGRFFHRYISTEFQAFPIETKRDHILGNVSMLPNSKLLYGLKNSKQIAAGTKLACINVLDKDLKHIGKVYLTK